MMFGCRLSGVAVAVGLLLPISASGQEVIATPAAAKPAVTAVVPVLTLPQWTRVNPAGELRGSIVRPGAAGSLRSIPNLEVSLITQGQIVARVATNADGDFSFAQVVPGYYTVVASNPTDLLVFALAVSESDGSQVEPTLFVAASPITADRRQAMLAAVFGPMAPPASPAPTGPVVPMNVLGIYDIELQPGGVLSGHAMMMGGGNTVDMSRMIVRLTRESAVLGEAPLAADGTFSIPNLSPGPASVFAFGPQGFSAFGVNLVAGNRISTLNAGASETFVTAQGGSSFSFGVASMGDVAAGAGVPGDSFNPPAPLAGPLGAPGGGFGGGGAGGGGSGVGGGIGGLAAAALAAAALAASNDNNNNFTPPSTSDAGIIVPR
jgi:hypothetical protein